MKTTNLFVKIVFYLINKIIFHRRNECLREINRHKAITVCGNINTNNNQNYQNSTTLYEIYDDLLAILDQSIKKMFQCVIFHFCLPNCS